MPKGSPSADAGSTPAFEPEFVESLKQLFEEMIVFNRVLGLKITHIGADEVRARIVMRPELVGHYQYNRLHGGVISASLDGLGGLAVMAAIGARHMDEAPAQRLQRFGKLGTIDRNKLNVVGGSVALGHPFGATGARLIATLGKLLEKKGRGRGLISICTGGGMGVTAILERP